MGPVVLKKPTLGWFVYSLPFWKTRSFFCVIVVGVGNCQVGKVIYSNLYDSLVLSAMNQERNWFRVLPIGRCGKMYFVPLPVVAGSLQSPLST